MVIWVLLAGLPGSGKSTLARAIAARLNAVVIDKDRVREALFPGPLTDYTAEQDNLCFKAMLESATYITAHRQADFVILDGRTFSRSSHIEQAVQAARRAGARWKILHVISSEAVAEARLAGTDPSHPARNRNLDLYHRVRREFQPIAYPKLTVDTSADIEPELPGVLAYISGVDE
jgi:predicted kinase